MTSIFILLLHKFNMEDHYAQLLAKQTPQRSAVKSAFIQKCISFGSTRKGLSFEDSVMDGGFPASGEPSMSFGQGNEMNSSVSGIFENDFSNVSKMELTNMSRGDFLIDRMDLTNRSQMEFSNMQNMNFTNGSKMDFTNVSKMDFTNVSQMNFTDVDKGEYDTALSIITKPSVTDSLYDDFLEFFISYSAEHEIFNLLLNYEEICCRGFETVSKMVMKNTCTETSLSKVSDMLTSLQLERNTWRLLRILFQDRLEADMVDEAEMLMSTLGKTSDKQIVDNLYQKDAYIRQSQLIVDWLEKNNEEDIQSTFFDKFEHFTDKCIALEHSLNELTTSNINRNHKSIREMDPDAAFRQESYPLHETDKENERRLFKFMFICIRAGKLDEAQQLAERFGEAWLAAALEGWRLHHDPNYEAEVTAGQELQTIEGNKYRDLWKAACWEASQSPVVSPYEQAIYGALCGNLKAVLSVCQTWEDYLWAYARTSLDKLIEREIRNFTQQGRSLEELPMEYWDKVLDVEEIFHELEASAVKSSCKMNHHVIQKYIILDDLGGLIEEMYSWLISNNSLDGQILRCMAHIILFLRVVGRSTKEELCVPILEAYVQELIKARKVSLIAPYVSTLPKEQQIIWYARFLEGITDNDERQKCLKYAEEAGLDVPQITKMVVKNIREKDPIKMEETDLSGKEALEAAIEKREQLSSWLVLAILLCCGSGEEAIEAAIEKRLPRRRPIFGAGESTTQRKMEAAKLLFRKIPTDSVAVMIQLSKANGFEELPADDDNTTREYLCFKAYLEAMDAFNNWFHHSIHGKPKQPPPPTGDHIGFKEKVAYEHEQQQFQKDLERWQSVVNMLGSTATECLYNVLLFVNGGWMIDQRTDGTSDPNRQQQMAHLRKFCIPHVTRLLHDVLLTEEKYKESIQLVDFIFSERYELYKEFSPEDIKQFLKVSLDSSFALLDKNMDPLGYSSKLIEETS
ncbi:hypothetical protein JTE90_026304 [Oedothorax gibbosus]|uniref:Nuclear pore complex protein n=1 Tax=Oedothorax gibbosus TaxID=931172 RepID=A0AAV6U5V1_9ARAC|nr:hypothetical protein JTE90_026304 [Oedothorax gibbosus]